MLIISLSMMVGVAVFAGVAIFLMRSGRLPGPQPKPYGTGLLVSFPSAWPSRPLKDGGGSRSIVGRMGLLRSGPIPCR